MTAWEKSQSNDKPLELTLDGNDSYIQCRNIKEVEASKDDNGKDIPKHYEYEMRFLTVSEYEMLNAMQNIMHGQTEV